MTPIHICPKCGTPGEVCDTHKISGMTISQLVDTFGVKKGTFSSRYFEFKRNRLQWDQVIAPPTDRYALRAEKERMSEKYDVSVGAITKHMRLNKSFTPEQAAQSVTAYKKQRAEASADIDRKLGGGSKACPLAAKFASMPL